MRFKLLYTAIAVGMLSLSACKQKTTAETAVSSDSVATVVDSQRLEMSSAEDLSLKVFSENLKTEHCSYETSIVLAQSKEHPHLATAINEWVNERLGGKYEGDINDGQAMLNYYQKRWVREEDDDIINGEYNISITKVYETDKYITFEASSYWYFGGAHGGSSLSGATFRKSDGRKFDKSMISDENALHPLLIKGLVKAFDARNKKELGELLMFSGACDSDNAEMKLINLPLPETEPWLTKEGLQLVYQQYEIGPYAVGMPTVQIPFAKLKSLLNASGKTYLK